MPADTTAAYRVGIRDLLNRPGQLRERRLSLPVSEKMGEGLVAVPAGGTLDVDLRLESVHEGILASGTVTGTATGICGRCLTDIELPVEVDFQELFAYSADEAFDFEVQDDRVDLEPLVRDAVVLSLPFQPVCRPDCPGLDPETGERLADQPERAPHQTFDPRWAALEALRSSDESEVDRPADAGPASPDREES